MADKYAKLWTSLLYDEWFVGLTAIERGIWLQLIIIAKQLGDNSRIFQRNFPALAATMGTDRKTLRRVAGKFHADGKINLQELENGSIDITILKYEFYQEVKNAKDNSSGEIGEKSRKNRGLFPVGAATEAENGNGLGQARGKFHEAGFVNIADNEVSHCETRLVMGKVAEKSQKNPTLPTQTNTEHIELELVNFVSVQQGWNLFAESNGLTRINSITDKRKKSVKARLAQSGFEPKLVYEKICDSNFLLGENDRGWRCDFDFVWGSPDNWVKIIEGKYDRPKKKAVVGSGKIDCPEYQDGDDGYNR